MKIKHFILALPIIATLNLFADKKMTVRNADTGESFEVTVPDGITVREYDPDRLDSVPYLTEHARWREPWAYKALAECYRYGKGGVERSLLAACMYYDEAGVSMEDLIEESKPDDRDDFDIWLNIIRNDTKPDSSVTSKADEWPGSEPGWVLMAKEVKRLEPEQQIDYIESKITPGASIDELITAIIFLQKRNPDFFRESIESGDKRGYIKTLTDRIPFLSDDLGGKLWINYYDQPDAEEDRRDLALKYMYQADKAGLLSKGNMARILTYCEEHGRGDKFPFSDEDLSRFDQICPKEYRDAFNSPAVVEEEVVEEVVVGEEIE